VNSRFALRDSSLRQALLIYILTLAILWCIAFTIVAIQSFGLHRLYPYDTIFFLRDVRFTDFTIFYPRFELYGQGERFFSLPGFPFTYPAPLLLCMLGVWKVAPHPLRAYLCMVAVFAIFSGVFALRALPNSQRLGLAGAAAVISAAIASFPLFFLLDRANLEGFVWIAASIGLACFVRRRYSSAAVFLALAASMKLFPGVLLLLLLAKRRYRDFALAMASCAAFTLGSLWIAGPTLTRAAKGIATGMDFFRRTQVLAFRPMEVGFDHSLFGCVKQIAFRFIHDELRLSAVLPRIYFIYAAFAILAFGALYLLRLRRMPVLNQLLALSALSVTLPFISYEYTLVHLIAPFIVLILFLVSDVSSGRVPLERRQILSLLLPYAILFAPMSYFLYHGFGFGGQIKALALLYLAGVASWVRMPSSLFSELSDRMVMEFRFELTQPEFEPSRQLVSTATGPAGPTR
jgi:hypothetical protein